MKTRITRLLGWSLTVTLAVVLSANCGIGSDMTAAQEACCAAMGPDCGLGAHHQNCCSTEIHKVDQSIAAKPITVPPLVLFFGPGVEPTYSSHSPSSDRQTQFDGFASAPPGIPTYVFTSALLI